MGKPVPGEGNPDAHVVFVGEAPGRKEAESGRPFVGRAGQWLRGAIKNIGLDERDDRTYLITSHPAAAARFPATRKTVLQDFRKLKALVTELK